jgi:hypothetical protein
VLVHFPLPQQVVFNFSNASKGLYPHKDKLIITQPRRIAIPPFAYPKPGMPGKNKKPREFLAGTSLGLFPWAEFQAVDFEPTPTLLILP